MIYDVTHETRYRYGTSISTGHHRLNLTPREEPGQRIVRSSIAIEPAPSYRSERTDAFGNRSTYVEIESPHDELVVTASSTVEVLPVPTEPTDDRPWEELREALWGERAATAERLEGTAFAVASPYVPLDPELRAWALGSFRPGRTLVDAAMDLTLRIHDEFTFDPAATSVATPVTEVFEARRGVCQDFAHLELSCLRSLGLAARYVSGYLRTDPPPGKPRLLGADASHAWVSLFAPPIGWVDLDPTNGCRRGERHVVLARGRDFGDVSPLRGHLLGGSAHEPDVAVDVLPAA